MRKFGLEIALLVAVFQIIYPVRGGFTAVLVRFLVWIWIARFILFLVVFDVFIVQAFAGFFQRFLLIIWVFLANCSNFVEFRWFFAGFLWVVARSLLSGLEEAEEYFSFLAGIALLLRFGLAWWLRGQIFIGREARFAFFAFLNLNVNLVKNLVDFANYVQIWLKFRLFLVVIGTIFRVFNGNLEATLCNLESVCRNLGFLGSEWWVPLLVFRKWGIILIFVVIILGFVLGFFLFKAGFLLVFFEDFRFLVRIGRKFADSIAFLGLVCFLVVGIWIGCLGRGGFLFVVLVGGLVAWFWDHFAFF